MVKRSKVADKRNRSDDIPLLMGCPDLHHNLGHQKALTGNVESDL
jgi:hypothetical protein